VRCHTALITPRAKAGLQIIAVSLAIVILVIAATVFPFLSIKVAGMQNSVSILDAALAFSDGPLIALALSTAALIIFIPLLRVALRPWSMAEIFAIGCAVALVKITDLADVTFGPAFWLFAILVVLVVAQDNFMCRWTVWKSLDGLRKPELRKPERPE